MLRPLLLSALSLAACSICSASALYFNGSGTFNATDTRDAIVIPGDTFNFNFVVQRNPVINGTDSTMSTFDVPVFGFYYQLNGTLVNVGQPSEITFYTSGAGGGFALNFANGTQFLFGNSQYFTGSPTGVPSLPTFSPSRFSGETFAFSDPNNVDAGSANVNITPTPEPSSLFLLCGGLGLLAVGIRKSVGIRKQE